MSQQIVLPRLLQIGAGASTQVGQILQSLGASRRVIITDPMMVKPGYVERIQAHLPPGDVYADTVPEPTDSSLRGGVARVRQGHYDCLIAVGGGSPIDSAKAISILGIY